MKKNEEGGFDQSSKEREALEFRRRARADHLIRESLNSLANDFSIIYADSQMSFLEKELRKAVQAMDDELLKKMKKAGKIPGGSSDDASKEEASEPSDDVSEEEGLDPIDVLPTPHTLLHPHIKSASRFKQVPFSR